jgi:hypothetical protein
MHEMNIKKRIKYRKKLRYTKRNQRHSRRRLLLIVEEIQDGITVNSKKLRDFDNGEVKRTVVSSYYYDFSKKNWEGMITIKFYESSFSQDNDVSRKKRMNFLERFMGNLRNKMKISHNDFQWVACEEFGMSGVGHFHVLFSLENLSQRKKDKMEITDFSENGDFLAELRESANFVWQKSNEMSENPDIHWSHQWENDGLVRYFCKIEDQRTEKHYVFSQYHTKQGLIKVA